MSGNKKITLAFSASAMAYNVSMLNLFPRFYKKNSASAEKIKNERGGNSSKPQIQSQSKFSACAITERIFYRNLAGNWTEKAHEIPIKNILLCAVEKDEGKSKKTECFCHLHRKFEEAQIADDKVIFKCGATAKGVAIPFVMSPDYLIKTYERMEELDKILKDSYEHQLTGQSIIEQAKKEYQQYKNKIAEFEEACLQKQNELPQDVFAIKIYNDTTSKRHILKITEFNRKKIYDELPYRLTDNFTSCKHFVFDVGHLNEKLFSKNNIPMLFEKYQLPENIKNILVASVLGGINDWAGKQLEFHTNLSGLELLNAAAFFPYEPNVYPALKYFFRRKSEKIFAVISKNDTDIVKTICRLYGAEPYRTLRKYFMEEPAVLFFYIKFYERGFRDKNFFNEIFAELKDTGFSKIFSVLEKRHGVLPRFLPTTNSNVVYHILLEYADVGFLEFFCRISLPLRGEKAPYEALTRAKNIPKEIALDTIRMFEQAYVYLSEDEKTKILKEGVTQYNHDLLAKIINHNKNKNVEFHFTKEQLTLEDCVEGYNFMLPKDYYELLDLGSAMSNCVAGYKDLVLKGTSTIVSVSKDNEYQACIEVCGNNIVRQKLGICNSKLKGEVAQAVNAWLEKHGLKTED